MTSFFFTSTCDVCRGRKEWLRQQRYQKNYCGDQLLSQEISMGTQHLFDFILTLKYSFGCLYPYFTTLPFLLILPIVLAVSKSELFPSVKKGPTSFPWAGSAPVELLICFSVHMQRILLKRSPESLQTSDMQILNRKQNFHYQIWEYVVMLVFIVGGLCKNYITEIFCQKS